MLNKFTDQELYDELRKRQEIEDARRAKKPKLKNPICIGELVSNCEKYIDKLYKDGWIDDNFPIYIFEVAMKTVFGKDVIDWIRENKIMKTTDENEYLKEQVAVLHSALLRIMATRKPNRAYSDGVTEIYDWTRTALDEYSTNEFNRRCELEDVK